MVSRGQIWWVDLAEPVGSEPGYSRPGIVISANQFNRTQIATVTICMLYSNLSVARHPGNVLLRAADVGLNRDSVANVTQIMTVDRHVLRDLIGAVPPSVMQQIDDGLRLAFDL
jgi:mRNA interferase MazF